MKTLLLALVLCATGAWATGGCSAAKPVAGHWQDTTAIVLIIIAFAAMSTGVFLKILTSTGSEYGNISGLSLISNWTVWKNQPGRVPINMFVIHCLIFSVLGVIATFHMEGYEKSSHGGLSVFRAMLTMAFTLYAISSYFVHEAHDQDKDLGQDSRSMALLVVNVGMAAAIVVLSVWSAIDKDGPYNIFGYLGLLALLQLGGLWTHHVKLMRGSDAPPYADGFHMLFILGGAAGWVFMALAFARLPCVDGPN